MKINRLFLAISLVFFLYIPAHSELRDKSNQADYIIIYHPEFEPGIKRFAQWHSGRGLNVLTVNIDVLYSEFQQNNTKEAAIRDFLEYALKNWQQPKPRFLLLAGSIKHIPSKKIAAAVQSKPDNPDSVSLDEWYAVPKDDNSELPEIAIGRFPCADTNELNNIISKTIAFSENTGKPDYKYDAVLVTDKKDGEYFETLGETLLDGYFPADSRLNRINCRENSEYFGHKEDFIRSINEGSTFICSYGHGSKLNWHYGNLMSANELDTIKLSNKPFIFTAISCGQSFDDSTQRGIIEKVITMKNGGAVATFASVGANEAISANNVLENFYSEYFSNPGESIGQIIKNVKCKLGKSHYNTFVKMFSLLGDPALKIQSSVSMTNVEDVNDNTHFAYNEKNKIIIKNVDDNKEINTEFYDLMGNRISPSTVTRQMNNEVIYSFDSLAQGIYFCKTSNGDKQRVIKFIITME